MKKLERAQVNSSVDPKILRITGSVGDDSDSDEDSAVSNENIDSEGIVNGGTQNRGRKNNEKKTRAERNKMRKHSEQKQEALKVKAEKKLHEDLRSVKAISKEIATEEQQRNIARKAAKALLKEKNSQSPAMTYDEAGSVLLTDELTGSLRTLRPELCPIKSHIASMISNGDAISKDARKRKAYEKPHAGKQIKWVAKYKYS